MDPLTIIENRLEQLECKLGYPPEDPNEKSVIDQLMVVETVLNSITSGREKIADINRRIEDLNCYLDPHYVNLVNDSKLKSNYVLTNEPNIRHHCKNMELCKEKTAVLDSENISNIPNLEKSLSDIKAVNIENKDQCDQAEKCIQQMMETCHQVSLSIMENLVAINKRIDVLEKSTPI